MVGSLPDCCARAGSGHAAAPPRAAMNSRRLMSGIGSLVIIVGMFLLLVSQKL
jgi:hypothetical protein